MLAILVPQAACLVISELVPEEGITVASICPTEPTADKDLKVDFDGNCFADTLPSTTVNIEWFRNGTIYYPTESDNRIILSSETRKNEAWRARIYDLNGEFLVETTSVAIQNSPPTVKDLSVTPTTPVTTDNLTAKVQEMTDIDGDLVRLEFLWRTTGSTGTWDTAQLSSAFTRKAESWTVAVTPVDDEGLRGEPLTLSAPVIIRNSPPKAEISFAPENPASVDNISASVVTSDVDKDELSVSLSWQHMTKSTVIGSSLSASFTDRDDEWELRVVLNDGEEEVIQTERVTIVNDPPQLTFIEILPKSPRTTDDLNANIMVSDSDEDELSFRIVWEELTGTEKRYVLSETLPSSLTAKDEIWRLSIAPLDGISEGATLTSSCTIENSEPEVSSVSILQATPRTADELTAEVIATDIDGDRIVFEYQWEEISGTNKTVVATTLAASNTRKDEQWQVRVTPEDRAPDESVLSRGLALTSSAVTILNTPPTAGSVRAVDTAPIAHLPGAEQQPYCEVDGLGIDADGPEDILNHSMMYFDVDGSNVSFLNTEMVTTPIVYLSDSFFSHRGLSFHRELRCDLTTIDQSGTSSTASGSTEICVGEYVRFFNYATQNVADNVRLSFSGTNVSDPLAMASEGTIEAWVFWEGTRGGYLYSRGVDGAADVWIKVNRIDSGDYEGYGQARAIVSTEPGIDASMWDSSPSDDRTYSNGRLNLLLQPGTWNHLALQWRFNSMNPNQLETEIRVNGRQEAEGYLFSGNASLPSFTSSTSAYLGANVDRGTGFEGFDGALADFRVSRSLRYPWGNVDPNWMQAKDFVYDTDTQLLIDFETRTWTGAFSYNTSALFGTMSNPQNASLSFISQNPDTYRCLTP